MGSKAESWKDPSRITGFSSGRDEDDDNETEEDSQEQPSSSVDNTNNNNNNQNLVPLRQKKTRRITVEDNAKLFSHFRLLEERRKSKTNGRESGHRMCYCLHCERAYEAGMQTEDKSFWMDQRPVKMTRTRRDCYCHLRRCTAFVQYLDASGQENPFPPIKPNAAGGAGVIVEDCSKLIRYTPGIGIGGSGNGNGGGNYNSNNNNRGAGGGGVGATHNSTTTTDSDGPSAAAAAAAAAEAAASAAARGLIPIFPFNPAIPDPRLWTANAYATASISQLQQHQAPPPPPAPPMPPVAGAPDANMAGAAASGVKRKRGRPPKRGIASPVADATMTGSPGVVRMDQQQQPSGMMVRMDPQHQQQQQASFAAAASPVLAIGTPSRSSKPAAARNSARNTNMHTEENTMVGEMQMHLAPPPADALAKHVTEFLVDCALPLSILQRPSLQHLADFLRPGTSTQWSQGAADVLAQAQVKLIASMDQAIYERGHRPGMVLRTWMDRTKTRIHEIILTAGPVSYPLACRVAKGGDDVSCLPSQPKNAIAVARDWEQLLVSNYTAQQKRYHFSYVCVAVSTSSAARARRILALHHPSIFWNRCWDHQLNLMVLTLLQQMDSYRMTCVMAGESAAAMHSSNLAPTLQPLLRSVMKRMYGGERSSRRIYTLLESHWNSMQPCFASLLRIKDACKEFAKSSSVSIPEPCQAWKEDSFWTQLAQAERLIRPFCECSYMLQQQQRGGASVGWKRENTLAHVLFFFLYLHKHVAEQCGGTQQEASALVLQDLEKRWMREENPLFVLAFSLHPSFREFTVAMLAGSHKLQGNYSTAGNALSVARLAEAARFYYDKFELYNRRHDGRSNKNNMNNIKNEDDHDRRTGANSNKAKEELQNISKEMRKWLSGKEFAVEDYNPKESVVEWWEMHAFEYPELANLAMFLLDAPVVATTALAAVDAGQGGEGQWRPLGVPIARHYKPPNRHLGYDAVHQFNVMRHDWLQSKAQAAIHDKSSKTKDRRHAASVLKRHIFSPEPLVRIDGGDAATTKQEEQGVGTAAAVNTTTGETNNDSAGKLPAVDLWGINDHDGDDDILVDPNIWIRLMSESVPDDDDLDGFASPVKESHSANSSTSDAHPAAGYKSRVEEEEAAEAKHDERRLERLPLEKDAVFYPEEDASYFMRCINVRVDKYSLSKILCAAKEFDGRLPTLSTVYDG